MKYLVAWVGLSFLLLCLLIILLTSSGGVEGRLKKEKVVLNRAKQNWNDYTLSLLLMVRIWPERDEARENIGRLLEFVEYYRLLGVEHFYIYDDAGDPAEYFGEHPVMLWYRQRGIVTYDRVQDGPVYKPWSHERQHAVYKSAIQHYRAHNKWMLVLDMDEFIYFNDPHETLLSFLQEQLPNGWQNGSPRITQFLFHCWFVSGYLQDPSNNELRMIEQYLWRHKSATPIEKRAKMMAWIADLHDFGNIHRMIMRGGKTVAVPLSRAFMLHYWKQRMDVSDPRQLDYFPHLAHRFGPIVADNIANLALQTGLEPRQLAAGPYPITKSQSLFDPVAALALLNFDPSSPDDEPDTAEVLASIRLRVQALKDKAQAAQS